MVHSSSHTPSKYFIQIVEESRSSLWSSAAILLQRDQVSRWAWRPRFHSSRNKLSKMEEWSSPIDGTLISRIKLWIFLLMSMSCWWIFGWMRMIYRQQILLMCIRSQISTRHLMPTKRILSKPRSTLSIFIQIKTFCRLICANSHQKGSL